MYAKRIWLVYSLRLTITVYLKEKMMLWFYLSTERPAFEALVCSAGLGTCSIIINKGYHPVPHH